MGENGGYCQCQPNSTGMFCETPLECISNPCNNGKHNILAFLARIQKVLPEGVYFQQRFFLKKIMRERGPNTTKVSHHLPTSETPFKYTLVRTSLHIIANLCETLIVYQFNCIALFHSKTRRHMISKNNDHICI